VLWVSCRLVYWVVYAFFSIIETFVNVILYW
jgi:hypothetical protein